MHGLDLFCGIRRINGWFWRLAVSALPEGFGAEVSILPLGNLFHFYFSLLKANLLSVLGPCHTKFRLEFDEFSHSHVFGPRGGGT
jgi:hypothetical protein